MKSIFKAAALAVTLAMVSANTGCQSTTGTQTPQGVMKAAQVSLTVYRDVFQPAVLVYGRLPDCPQATICKERAVLTKIQAADLAATKTITAAQPVLNGSLPDGGQLASALEAISNAQKAIADSGALKLAN